MCKTYTLWKNSSFCSTCFQKLQKSVTWQLPCRRHGPAVLARPETWTAPCSCRPPAVVRPWGPCRWLPHGPETRVTVLLEQGYNYNNLNATFYCYTVDSFTFKWVVKWLKELEHRSIGLTSTYLKIWFR